MQVDQATDTMLAGDPNAPLGSTSTTTTLAAFDLVAATLRFLRSLGLVSPSTTTTTKPAATPPRATLKRNLEHLSTRVWLPLIPTQDAIVLLSFLPPTLRPTPNLPPSAAATFSSPNTVLDVLTKLALEPSLTLAIDRHYRPVAPHLWGKWLELLGLDFLNDGQWPAITTGEPRSGELEAIEKVFKAFVTLLPIDERVFPFLTTLLRHPLLDKPLVSPTNPIPSLLTVHALLRTVPHLPTSHHTTSPSRPLPWSLPLEVQHLLQTHPERKVRLLASKIVRSWYGLYAGEGDRLERRWVDDPDSVGSRKVDQVAPMPMYPRELEKEFAERFGPDQREDEEEWCVDDWDQEVVGEARWVDGGVELLVRKNAVDLWVLEIMMDLRDKRNRSRMEQEIGQDEEHVEVEGRATELWDLSRVVVDVAGELMYREGFIPSLTAPSHSINKTSSSSSTSATAKSPAPEKFVVTPSHERLLRSLARLLRHRIPILITSPPSSGKLSTLNHLWSLLHASSSSSTTPTRMAKQRGLVVINLADRSLDSKSLLGSLSSAPTTAASTAGSFTFIEGPLTRAVRQGRWVVLTNIDQASTDVLTVVKVVLERMRTSAERMVGGAWGDGADERNLGVGVRVGGGEGRWVKAGKGFMLFATRSSESSEFFASGFWEEVKLPGLEGQELELVVRGRFGKLPSALVGRMIEAWEGVRMVKGKEAGGGTKRDVGVRDLLRWCRRVEGLLPLDVDITSIESNPTLQEEVFIEARDVFLGSMPLPPFIADSAFVQNDRYSVIARLLASSLGLSAERAHWVLRRRVPEFIEPVIDLADGHRASRSDELALRIGRIALPYRPVLRKTVGKTYAHTNPSLIVLEKLAVCVRLSEPVLMVGETGTGKTAAVGHLADKMGKRLTALNLSNQTEAGDLVGGFRPIDELEEARRHASALVNAFVELFGKTFSISRNAEYVSHVKKAFDKKRWSRLVGLWREASRMANDRLKSVVDAELSAMATDEAEPRKRRKVDNKNKEDLPRQWADFLGQVGEFDVRHVQKAAKSKFVFSFVEGPLAKAIREGDWVLLDEVNLASAETLESLSTLLQGPDSSLVLTEQGDLEPIPRHPEFRLFACMNPATDVGKRDLPSGLRAKFSEVWVPPPDEDRDALVKIVEGYIARYATSDLPVIGQTADLYSSVKQLAINAQLADGSNHPPHFSMRTLARALTFGAEFAETFGSLRRALYEGFLMSFTMLLDPKSQTVVLELIKKHIVDPARNAKSLFRLPVKKPPASVPSVQIAPYWLATGDQTPEIPQDYILTASVQRKVCDLARAVLTRKVPVLIQGPTSAGKTSVVEYLARRTGHRFVRINNHEHTDIQEYVGTYVSDPDSGKLVFQEGVLVRALRRGDWVVLDELNLAPTDVLEALNRLLDDNRELVIPETGEVVRPHPHFMLFATQNPPGLYGGRKVLSRAFRNRFLEMHFGDVPQDELETILCERCQIAPSYAKKTVAVFVELQRRRQAGRVFEQKHAFATLRDLFRWGGRGSVGYQQLAEDGYMLLAERARRADDKRVVKEVIEQEMKVKIDEETLYDFSRLAELELPDPRPARSELVWTSAMRRLYFLIAAALKRDEPVLLVGETGAGKTSVCQALTLALGRQLHIVGCHQNTETADLLGGQRPLRNRAALQSALKQQVLSLFESAGQVVPPAAENHFEELILAFEPLVLSLAADAQAEAKDLLDRMRKTTALFEWHDGPLVQAMISGDMILLDEISLADDSVLERLNSVLEPSRTLVLAEKGGRDLADIQIRGRDGFQILATMNPGGDFGKKELSPALRNRFTEIWVPGVDDLADLRLIIYSRWQREHERELAQYGDKMLDFAQWFAKAAGAGEGLGIGLRDILGWIDFLNKSVSSLAASTLVTNGTEQGTIRINQALSESSSAALQLDLGDAFCQGALMTVVDGLGALPLTSSLGREGLERLRASCWRYLESLVSVTMAPEAVPLDVVDSTDVFSIGPFGIHKGGLPPASVEYTLLAPTTRLNAMRLLRALQLKKPVLLEGSPGVGKTSLVTAIAAATGHHLVRINLSDQTDLMDLLGSDLPVEGGQSGEFAWKDAPFLAAMQQGDWVLLDEMNLASQSILEGLNSCLDHRGAVFIPELDRTFVRHPDFRIFAAQNPLGQGGGRKGLPKSFLDRFSVVHMEELNATDLGAIASALHPDIDRAVLDRMITFNSTIHRQTMESRSFGIEGSPWEFNLRDVLRWLALIRKSGGLDLRQGDPIEYVGLLYLQRFRNVKDREHVARIFADTFSQSVDPSIRPVPLITTHHAQVGHSLLGRSDSNTLGQSTIATPLLHRSLQPLEALIKCLDMGWLAILTGPKSCGKTSLVRHVASLAGKTLREFSMSAEVDTLELLGSFEQAERFRELERIVVDALFFVEEVIRQQLKSLPSFDLAVDGHAALIQLQQLRLDLGASGADLDLEAAARVVVWALDSVAPVAPTDLVATLPELHSRLERAVAVTLTAACFEWIDGPLVQAMKQGDWLLIEDANLCSPSVLDRLNSLFETGGRLQLAERGPVNGEIQIIEPHPDFRLVMSLDPRNGELSRAMRNRGIEIAVLPTDESLSIMDSPPEGSNSFRDPGLAPILAAVGVASGNLDRQPLVLAQTVASYLTTAQYGAAIRLVRATTSLDAITFETCVRCLAAHPLVHHIEARKQQIATELQVPAMLLALEPTDLSLVPQSALVQAFVDSVLSPAFDALSSLVLAPSTRLDILRHVSAKPKKSLSAWDRSLLATHGKLRLDEGNSATASLAPVSIALATLVSQVLGEPLIQMSVEQQQESAKLAGLLDALASELAVICSASDLDFSSIQHVAAWIAAAIKQLPREMLGSAVSSTETALVPLQSSLTLTSGKAMDELWKAYLPFEPPSAAIAAAYRDLVKRGSKSAGDNWDRGLVDLFLEISVALGTPQLQGGAVYETDAPTLVKKLLSSLPAPRQASAALDEGTALATSSNAASVLVSELAAVANVLGGGDWQLASASLVRVVHKSQVLPLINIVPMHQLVSWPRKTTPDGKNDQLSVKFQTLLTWNEHLALGLAEVSSPYSAADVVRPFLLREVVQLNSTDTSSLGNLVVLSEALGRAANVQAWTAASDTTSRVSALRAALLASIGLIVDAATESYEWERTGVTGLKNLEESSALRESVDRYIAPIVPALAERSTGIDAIGRGFVAFARCLWHLYLPNLPLDPAVGLRARSGFLARQLIKLTDVFESLRAAESSLTGNSRNAKMDRIGAEIEVLRQQLDKAGVVPVTREGNPALLSSLFQELRSFHEQIISDSQLDSLLRDLADAPSKGDLSRESNMQRSIETLLRRLDVAYSDLVDILAPVRLALCSVKIGFAFLAHVAQSATAAPSSAHFATLLHHLASFPKAAHVHAIESVELPLALKVGEAPLAPTRATLLQITALVGRLVNGAQFDRASVRRLTQLYDRLHYLWTTDRRHDEEAAREAQSLYKSKVDVDQIATDEELEAAEFANLFPTFEDPMNEQDGDSGAAIKAPLTNGATPSTKVHHHVQLLDQAMLSNMHVGLFGSRGVTFATTCDKDFDTLRSASIAALIPKLFDHLDETLDRRSAAYRIRSLVELSQATKPSSSADGPHRDFYTEPDVQETAKAVPILLAMSARLSDLIETWPDQMVLKNLYDRCQTVLGLSSRSPIAQVLTALEQLLQHTEDWESYASREHSLATNRTEIINIIIEWRRTELTCWSRLLSTMQDRFGDPVAEWWFRFYETTIRGAPGVDDDPEVPADERKAPAEYYRELVGLLDSFFTSCSIGQFNTRLELVLSFANFASKLGAHVHDDEENDGARSLRTVGQLLLNVHAFYDQFSPRISAFLMAERAKIDKDVQSLIKLASWKDVNVYALRQSAIKSHHQLYKNVRKLRAVLQKPASDFFIRSAVAQSTEHASANPSAVHALDVSSLTLPPIPEQVASNSDAPRIVNLDQTLRRLARLATTSLGPFTAVDRAEPVDAFATEIIRTSKDLKNEPLGEEEGREQRVKSLVTRKRRAWIELLRETKRLGLSPSPAPNVVERLKDAGQVYALPSSRLVTSLDAALLPNDMRRQLHEVDDYHYRMLSELPALRACPVNHHDDVSTREVQRAIGSVESCVTMGFDSRLQIVSAVSTQVHLALIGRKMEAVGAEGTAQCQRTSKELAESLFEIVSQVSDALSEARIELGNHRTALAGRPTDDLSSVTSLVNNSASMLSHDLEQLKELVSLTHTFDPILSTSTELETLKVSHAHLSMTIEKFSEFEAPPSIRYLVEPLAEWIKSIQLPSLAPSSNSSSSIGSDAALAALNVEHATLIDSILVIAQEVNKRADQDVKVDPDAEIRDSAIKLDHRSLQETLAICRSDEVVAKVDAFTRHAHQLLSSSSNDGAACALLGRVAPFVRLFADLLAQHLDSYLRWYRATLKLSYVISSVVKDLSAQGFCRPAEDDGKGGEEADGKTSEGTGMADGQGAKNVSNEIEDESQIEGLENDVQQEKDKNDLEDEEDGNDDAIEMSMDFDGDLEDRGDGEKDDKEDADDDSDDESEVPEPDEQVADVDPLDPSSVDEKFWGDEDSKDEPKDLANEEVNQETKQQSGESEMAAKEEEAPAPQPKGQEAGDEAEKEQAEQQQEEKGGKEEGMEMDGEQEDKDGEQEDKDGEEGDENEKEEGGDDDQQDGDAVPQTDDKERLDDRMPEADNLDLPDDLNLDAEDKNKDDDDIDLDDMDSLPADPDEGESNDRQDELDEIGDSKDEPDEGEDPLLADNETQLQPDNDDAPAPDEQPSLDQSLGGVQDGETGGEGAQDDSAAAPADPTPAPADASKRSGAQPDAEQSSEPVPEEAQDAAAEEKEMADDDGSTEPPPSAPSNAANGRSKERSSASDPQAQAQPDQSAPTQPQRSLGDAMQSWRRRLEQIADMTETTEESPAEVDHSSNDKNGEVEYVPEGNEQEADEQALGPASEEQVKKLELLRLGEEEEPQKHFEVDEMQVDEPNANQAQQPSSMVQLDGSSLAESDAKAIPAAELRDEGTVAEEDVEDFDEKMERDEDEELHSTTLAPQIDAEADAQVEQAMLQWRSGEDPTMTADGVWRLYESLTRDLSYALTEQLRLILEPTLATRLKGDYRSGKRLNLKKIIPYIASEFTKDKIWLRRTRPSQREYQILIAIDDSKSMADSHSVHLAFQSLALISRALTRLEVGGISICRFGDTMDILHPFEGGPLSDDAGAKLLSQFTFSQRTTDVRLLVERSLAHLTLAKETARSGKSSLAAGDLWQLQVIISDGMCQDHEALRALLRRAAEQKVMFVFVVIDSLHRQTLADPVSGTSTPVKAPSSDVNQNSILAMQSVSYSKGNDGRLELKMNRYLDSFPFEYFVVLRDVEALPEVLSATLRQFFERVSSDR